MFQIPPVYPLIPPLSVPSDAVLAKTNNLSDSENTISHAGQVSWAELVLKMIPLGRAPENRGCVFISTVMELVTSFWRSADGRLW